MAEQLAPKVEGVTPGEIERGLAAARQVFAAAGVTAAEAVAASAHRQALDEVLDSCGVHALMDGIETLKEQGVHPSIVAAAEAELVTSQPGMRRLSKREDELARLLERSLLGGAARMLSGMAKPADRRRA